MQRRNRLALLKKDELIMKHCLKIVYCTAASARLMECEKMARHLRSMDIQINEVGQHLVKRQADYCSSVEPVLLKKSPV